MDAVAAEATIRWLSCAAIHVQCARMPSSCRPQKPGHARNLEAWTRGAAHGPPGFVDVRGNGVDLCGQARGAGQLQAQQVLALWLRVERWGLGLCKSNASAGKKLGMLNARFAAVCRAFARGGRFSYSAWQAPALSQNSAPVVPGRHLCQGDDN